APAKPPLQRRGPQKGITRSERRAPPHPNPLPKREGTEGEDHFIASTPPMISDNSVVIWLCRARLYCMVSAFTILSALSVALFIATIRATCSLVVASRNAWNIAVLTVSGRSSSSNSFALGEKSYI